jgi:hypothetical protein
MASAALEVEIINKVTNLGAVTEEKAALSGLGGGGFTPLGGGSVNFGGSLSKGEQATAAAQMAEIEAKSKAAGLGLRDVSAAAAVTGTEVGALTSKMGALGALGLTPTTVALIGGVAAAGLFIDKLNEMATISDKNEEANKDLTQAYKTLNENVPTKTIEQFITTNKQFIPSIYDVKEGFAQLARAQLDDTTQMRVMNDALNLAWAKHIDLGTAVEILTKAYSGNVRGLIDLGFSQKDVTEAVGKGADKSQHYGEVLKLVEQRTANGKQAATDLQRAQNEQNIEWQKFSDDYGPEVVSWQTNITKATTGVVDITKTMMDHLKNDSGPAFNAIDGFLVGTIQHFQDLTGAINGAYDAWLKWGGSGGATSAPGSARQAQLGRNGSNNLRQRGFGPFGPGGQ